MQPSTLETAATHIESHTQTWLTIAAAVGPTLALVGVVYVAVKWGIPAWREESKANREHLADLVAKRGKEALEDVAATRELEATKQKAIVDKIGTRVDEVHARVSATHETIQRIAMKIGAGVLLLFSYGAGIASGYQLAHRQTEYAQPFSANECPKGCSAGWHCCSKDGQCCENKKATAAIKIGPTTASKWTEMLTYADGQCHGAHQLCW